MLSDEDLALVEKFRAGDRICEAHQDIYQQDDELDELYTVVEAWVCLIKLLEDSRRQITRIALPGDFIGYQADLTRPMDHTAERLTPVRLCVFPRQRFLDFIRSHAKLAIRLTWMIATYGELGRDRLLSVGRQSAIERIAHFLLELFYCAAMVLRSLPDSFSRIDPDHDIARRPGLLVQFPGCGNTNLQYTRSYARSDPSADSWDRTNGVRDGT